MSGDVTEQALARLSHLPDSNNPADLIAAQKYYDVEFTGGSISNVTLTDVTVNGTATSRHETIVTAAGGYTVTSDDYVITLNKTVAATTTVTLPASPTTSRSIIVKDGKGDAATHNATISGNGKTIDGAATFVISDNYGSVEIIYNGTEWNVIGNYQEASSVTSVNGQTGTVVLDTDDISEGSTNLYFTTERAQDATGAMVDSTLVYNDASNGLSRAAISGDVTIAQGSNTAAITAGAIVNADINASAAIDASKIANGSVSSIEFQTLDGIASNIQTQINGKQPNIQFKDEGVNQGSSGGVSTVNFTGTGVTATESSGTLTVNITAGGGGGASGFDAITSGTNTTAAMVVGTGASLAASGSGTITATAVPASGLTGTTLPAGVVTSSLTSVGTLGSLTVTGNAAAGSFSVGTLGYTASNPLITAQSSVAGFNQIVSQNTSSGATSSADIVVNNNQSTDTTFYGDFGINSSGFTGSGSLNAPNNVYLTATSGDLAIGTTTANAIKFVVNGGSTDAASISSAGTFTINTLTATNTITGSISGNAATVTTNANLTGVITSVGNTTSIASQTGTGTKFVVDTSPTLVTPNIGTATGTGLILTSSSATALAVGLNGSTNPALTVDASTATSATGLKVKSAAAAGGCALSVTSSGAAENLTINALGTGTIGIGSVSTGAITLSRATTISGTLTQTGAITQTAGNSTFTCAASGTAAGARFQVVGAADTALTASTEAPWMLLNNSQTRQHATGALALQRDVLIQGPAHTFVAASTLTDHAILAISPSTGAITNATITNQHNLYIPTVVLATGVTNSYGLTVAATTGATNNFAAQFTGGVLFNDATTPTKQLTISTSGSTASTLTTLASSSTIARTLTLPDATDTLVGKATTDTLINKTLDSATIATTQAASDNSTKVATTAYVDRTGFVIPMFEASVAQATTAYQGPCTTTPNATETVVAFPMSGSGVITGLNVRLQSNVGGTAQTSVYTVMYNGVAQAVTCTINTGAFTGSDTAHSFAYNNGDTISVRIANSATSGTTIAHMSISGRKTG